LPSLENPQRVFMRIVSTKTRAAKKVDPYQVHNAQLKLCHKRAKTAQHEFICVDFEHVRREHNCEADQLARKGVAMNYHRRLC
jgi:hypothetical protein